MQHHYTKLVSHIEECIYTHGRHTSPHPPIDQRSMAHHYTAEVSHIEGCTPHPWVMMTLSLTPQVVTTGDQDLYQVRS